MTSRYTKIGSLVRSVARPVLAGLVVVGLAACSDVGPTGPELSNAELESVATAISNGMGQAFSAAISDGSAAVIPGASAPGSLSPVEIAGDQTAWSFDQTSSCPVSGAARASGSGTITTDGSGGGSALDWAADASFDDCVVDSDAGTFNLATSTPVHFQGTGQVTSSSGTFAWAYSGTVNWSNSSARSGSCDVDLSASLTYEEGTGSWSGTVAGSVCNREVDTLWDTTITADG